MRQEARIVSGLKRPAIGKPAARTGGRPEGAGGWALRMAAVSGAAFARTRPVTSRLGGWATGRQISPGTLSVISLLLALCAAIWLSGAAADRAGGLLALAGSVLAMAGAGRLAAFTSKDAVRPRLAARRRPGADDSTDWLALPDVPWAGEQPAGAARGPQDGTGGDPDDDDDVVVVVSENGGAPEQRVASSDRIAPAEAPGPAAGSGQAGGVPGAPGASRFGRWPSADEAAAARESASASWSYRDDAPGGLSYGWLAAVSAAAAESAIYGGLAAGGGPAGPIRMWPLAVLTIASVGATDLLGACRVASAGAAGAGLTGETPSSRAWEERLPGLPAGARVVLAGLALAISGPQAALYSVLGAEVLLLAWMVLALGRIAPAPDATSGMGAARARRRRPGRTGRDGASVLGAMGRSRAEAAPPGEIGTRTRVTAVVGVDGPAGTTAVRIITSAMGTKTARGQFRDTGDLAPADGDEDSDGQAGGAEAAAGRDAGSVGEQSGGPIPAGGVNAGAGEIEGEAILVAGVAAGTGGEQPEPIPVGGVAGTARSAQPAPPEDGMTGSARGETDGTDGTDKADQGRGESPVRPAAGVLALRDDGAAAMWAGRLVQGNLIPLPPALAGLVATAMLAALGLRDLHGFVAITPPVVMMLAAPGASHPHDGRFDWLVPGLLALAQFVYLGALGFAVAVPGPIVFAACALTAVWYASLAAGGGAANGPMARSDGILAGAGWEVRLFLTGLAVTFGLGTFGYVGLAAYLGVLLCRQAAARDQTRMEDDRQ